MARALESRDTLSHAFCVFASLIDQVREKKDVPLGPEDPKEEDGSFDYRCVIPWLPFTHSAPCWWTVLTALSSALPSEHWAWLGRLCPSDSTCSSWLCRPRQSPHGPTHAFREQHLTLN